MSADLKLKLAPADGIPVERPSQGIAADGHVADRTFRPGLADLEPERVELLPADDALRLGMDAMNRVMFQLLGGGGTVGRKREPKLDLVAATGDGRDELKG